MLNLRVPVKKQTLEHPTALTRELSLFEKINKLANNMVTTTRRHEKLLALTEKPDFEIIDEEDSIL